MRCPLGRDKSRELAVSYTARTLDSRARADFQRHLESCVACAEAVAAQQAVWNALDEWRDVAVSSDFDHTLRIRIAREEQAESGWRRSLLRSWRPAVPVVAAGILLSVAVWLNRPREVQTAPSPAHQVSVQMEKLEHALDDMDLLGQLNPI